MLLMGSWIIFEQLKCEEPGNSAKKETYVRLLINDGIVAVGVKVTKV